MDANTISDREWARLQDRARRHEAANGGMLGDEATRRRKANDPGKAGTN